MAEKMSENIEAPSNDLIELLKNELHCNIETIDEKELGEINKELKIYLQWLKEQLESNGIDLEEHITIEEFLDGIKKDRGKEIKETTYVKKINGELTDIVNKNDEVIGITELGISHIFGLRHRTVNCFVFSPDLRMILQRRVHNTAEAKKLTIFGGHVMVGETYEDAMCRELLEELSLDEIEEDLCGKLFIVGEEGQFKCDEKDNKEFRSLYVYVLDNDEYEHILRRKKYIDYEKAKRTEKEFEKWIEDEQQIKNGYGEVWGYHVVDFKKVTSRMKFCLEKICWKKLCGPIILKNSYREKLCTKETYKRKQVFEEVGYSSDLLLPLISGEASSRKGFRNINIMQEVSNIVINLIKKAPINNQPDAESYRTFIANKWTDIHHSRLQEWSALGAITAIHLGLLYIFNHIGEKIENSNTWFIIGAILICLFGCIFNILGALITCRHRRLMIVSIDWINQASKRLGLVQPEGIVPEKDEQKEPLSYDGLSSPSIFSVSWLILLIYIFLLIFDGLATLFMIMMKLEVIT